MSEALQARGIPTIFGDVFQNRVTFCIDTSGSMYNYIHVVKEHLIETLCKHANRDRETMFNLVEFNSGVTKWADKMVKCTPETVGVAAEWINNLSAQTGTNTQDALLASFSDNECDAVYLVTDSLPDQYPDDVIDETVNVCQDRPVHCIYISEETPDERTVDFLEDLAVDTFGSLHIVSLTRHGCVERITPIYRADHAHEKIIRTVNGKILPNIKKCSVSTTLNTNPEDSMYLASRYYNTAHHPTMAPFSPFWWLHPYRYYYPNTWSRYRPAKSWLKQQQDILDTTDLKLSPSAGALLIGKTVLARRIDDGYFYFGKVQSQLFAEKFLVAFGPCKHGKYKDITYQETFIYDIISYEDAKRHAILTNDKVLATFEADGEKFSPGVVLEGQEKRDLEGPDDEQLSVSFFNGKSSKVPYNSTVWIPDEVYSRLSLELKMPKEAREALQQSDAYPKESLPGYPTSGVVASPDSYQLPDPVSLDYEAVYTDPGFYPYPRALPAYLPYPPVVYKMDAPKAPAQSYSVKSEDMNALIPGTELTRRELEDKVMSQLMENTALLENKLSSPIVEEPREVEEIREAREAEIIQDIPVETMESERLLSKREKQEDNFLKKSVSFKDEDEYFDAKRQASPHLSRSVEFESIPNRDMGVNTDYRLYERRIPPMRKRPEWKNYWASGGIPEIIEPNSYEPFRETASQAPLEARDRNRVNYYGNWTSPMYNVVDPFAKYNYDNSMGQLMRPPKPPNYSPDKQGPGQEIGYAIGSGDMSDEQKEVARREYRRRQIAQRQQEWDSRMAEQEVQSSQMYEQQKQKIVDQMNADKARQESEHKQIQEARLAKRHIRLELKAKREQDRKQELGRDQRRIEAMRQRRHRREMAETNKLTEQAEERDRREAYKRERSQARWNEHHEKLLQQDLQNAASDQQKHEAKLKRIDHFRKLEEEGQKNKDLRIGVSGQHSALYRSHILA